MVVKMGTVWDRTAEFLSDNIAAVLPIALIAFFVPASIEGNFEAALTGASTQLMIVLRLLQLVFALLSVWGSLAIVALALDMATGRTAGQLATRRLPAALMVTLTILAGFLLLASPVLVALLMSGVDLVALSRGDAQLDLSAPVAGFVAIYMIVFLLVLIWLSARLIVATPVVVREHRALGAIPRSWRLSRGITWRIIGVLILYALVSWVAQLAANTVFGSIFALVAGGETEGVSLAGVLTSIVVAAVQTAFSVLAPAFTAKLYVALTAQTGLRQAAAEA